MTSLWTFLGEGKTQHCSFAALNPMPTACGRTPRGTLQLICGMHFRLPHSHLSHHSQRHLSPSKYLLCLSL